MNEAETRAEHIDPALKASGWGVVEGSRILREHRITAGRIEGHGRRGKADIADYVLVYLLPPVTRVERADHARVYINSQFTAKQQAFLDFVLQHYVTEGVTELDQSKLKPLLRLKYHDSITDAVADLGGKPEEISQVFAGFQKYLYQEKS
jgi:EcoEI R protein C-terminal